MSDCLPLRHVANLLNVRVKLLIDLAEAGHLEHHHHDGRMKITHSGVDEMRWRMAIAHDEIAV